MKISTTRIIIAVLILIVCFALYYSFYSLSEHFENTKNAIVVLTKGYDKNEDYEKLVSRNDSIYHKLYTSLKDKNEYDVIIFHEGNITEKQQEYIQSKTPDFPLQFRKVEFQNKVVNHPNCPNTDVSEKFSMGYKNMCYFWSISFFEYLKDYNYIIRVDEDCVLDRFEPNLIENYKRENIMFSSAKWQGDDELSVTTGMKELFTEFMKKHSKTPKNENASFPYTNFMVVNIPYFKNNEDVKAVLQEIDKSECIFSNRWGDLPIWGYILCYLIDKNVYKTETGVSYYHGSHDNVKIN